jgi:hypothetical protein
MTLLGKILTVLIFIMSLVFMSFAVAVYATQKNWRALVEATEATATTPLGYKERLKQEQLRNAELEQEMGRVRFTLAQERAARAQAVAAAEARYQQASNELDTLKAQFAKTQEDLRVATATLEANEKRLAALNAEVVGLRDEIRTAQLDRDKQFARVVALTDQLHQAEGLQRRLEERHGQLTRQIADMKLVLMKHRLPEVPTPDVPPKMDGLVLAVSTTKLVEVSLGSDDGLREGHTLEVYRENTYLGRIVIRKTSPDRSVAEIVPEFQKGLIQKGDRVATKIG